VGADDRDWRKERAARFQAARMRKLKSLLDRPGKRQAGAAAAKLPTDRPEAEEHHAPGAGLGKGRRLEGDVAAVRTDRAPRALNRQRVSAGAERLTEQAVSLAEIGVRCIRIQIELADN